MSQDTPTLDHAGLDETHESPEVCARRKRGMFFIGLAVGAVGCAMALQGGLNTNFLVEVIKITGDQQGVLEAFRESCGIIAFGLLALLAGVVEPLVGAGMLMVLAVGLGGYAFAPNYVWVVCLSMVWSQGLHIWMPLPNSMTLALAEPGRAGHRLGQMQSAGAAGAGVGLLAAFVLTKLGVSIRPQYLLAGAMAILAAWACLGIPRDIKTPGPRLVFRKRYGLYYLLCFLEGWRKQIFIAFAAFLLVDRYKAPLTTILILSGIISGINYFAAPRVGKMIDRVGERKVLLAYYLSLIAICSGYALIPNPHVLYVLYVLDGTIFLLGTAQTTYVNRIVPKAEHTATLSMGVAMNHIASVLMPLVGGLLWKYMGYQATFLVGVVAAALSVPVTFFVPGRKPGILT